MDSDYKRKIPDFARRLHEESEGEED